MPLFHLASTFAVVFTQLSGVKAASSTAISQRSNDLKRVSYAWQ